MWSGTMCEDRLEEFVLSPGSYLLSGGLLIPLFFLLGTWFLHLWNKS